MLKSLREQIQELEAQISDLEAGNAELEELIRVQKSDETTVAAKAQAQFFLKSVFAPYMDGICQEWGVSPEEALRILIEEKATFGKIAKNNPKDLEKLKNDPTVKVVLEVASPLGNASDEWINEKMHVLLKVMREIRPSLAKAIIETPGGPEWFYQSLVGLRDILYGVPKLDQVTRLDESHEPTSKTSS